MNNNYTFSLYPSCLDNTNFKYLNIDDKYLLSIIIYDYPSSITFTQIIEAIDKNYLYDMSIYIQKQDTQKVLQEISYYISTSKSEIKSSNENQIDIDILNKQELDAKNLRKSIQIDNEEVFKLNIIITFYSRNKDDLINIVKSFQSKLYSSQIFSSITNFRNLDSYLTTLPLNNYSNKIIDKTSRNITTSALCNIFPFYTKTVFDKNGIVFGYTNNENKLCIIDIFSDKYLNSNITIFGSSGSGKSYFTKLIILRHFLKGKIQYIFDLENEYQKLAKNLGINIINFENNLEKSYINILDITKNDLIVDSANILDLKVNEVITLLNSIESMNAYEKEIVKDAIVKAYLQKGISQDKNSIYKESKEEKIYVDKKIKSGDEFPCLKDVLVHIKDEDLGRKIRNIISEYEFFSNYTNIDFNMSCIFCTTNLNNKKLSIVTQYLLFRINKGLKNSLYEKEVIIYIDEIWKYIKSDEHNNISSLISQMYKSIRKNKASIVCITQDISDFFEIENGSYGKSILNNSEFKIFFKFEFSDSNILEKLNIITKENLDKITRLEKGSMLLGFCNNTAILKVKASNYEDEIIEGGIK